MGTVRASLEIIRPMNALMGGIGVVIGAFASGFFTAPNWIALVLAYLAVFCISAAGMLINDITDIEIDRVNCPERVLPSGRLSIKGARVQFLGYLAAGAILSLLTMNWMAIVIVAIGEVLVVVYSTKLKRLGLLGNVCVALVTAMALLLGGALQNRLDIAFWPALIAFLISVAREVTKGIDDIVGDTKGGVKTLAVRVGPRKAAGVATSFLVATILVAYIPYILLYFSVIFFIILLGIDVILAYIIVRLLRDPTPTTAHALKTLQKGVMFLGLIAFLLGAIPL